ncbi:putative N-acetyltransferase YycN [compost metagenome]
MIKLRKMTEDEYADYLKESLPSYAEEKMKGEGLSKEDALKVAQDSFNRLLPQGLKTENQFLFSVTDTISEKVIGTLWFAKKVEGTKSYAFIYDIILSPDVRGKGLGKELLSLAELEVRRLGLRSMGLHVFGHNQVAISLYEKTGFRTTNQIMVKDF